MQDSIRDLLNRRKNRAAAIILGVKDDECDDYLPEEASRVLRKVILDEMNSFYEICIDVIESLDNDTFLINDHWLEKLDEIHSCLVKEQALRADA